MVKGFSSNKDIKARKVGGIDIKIANSLLKMKIGFSAKCWQKVCTKLRKLNLKISFFSASEGGTSPSEASERELPLRYPLFNG